MRRILLATFLVLAAFANARAEGLAFVINSGAASVTLFDVSSGREVGRVAMLREPHHMALSPDHRFLLIGDSGGNEVLFLDPRTGQVVRRLPMADPYQLVFSPDGRFLTVAGLARNQVDVYDGATFALIKRFPLAAMPSHINYAPDSGTVYISLQKTGRLAAIDLHAMAVRWNQPVGDTPAGVLWLNGRILVGLMGADCVAVVDPADGHVQTCLRTGRGAHVLFLSHDRRTLYVTDRVDGGIVALDPATFREIRRYQIGGGPDDMDFGPDGRVWISRRFAHSVAILDPASGQIQTLETGRSPHGIWLNTHDSFPQSVADARDGRQ